MSRLAITWQVGDVSGWGVFGWNLVVELLARGRPRPVLLQPADLRGHNPLPLAVLAPLIDEQARIEAAAAGRPGRLATLEDTLVLHHLGNGLDPSPASLAFQGERNAAIVFLESTRLAPEAIARGRRFERVVAGSTWNGRLLEARGLDNVSVVLQGVDPALFHPAPGTRRLFKDRFVVFSGGKLEYRKGQDIVLAAFRAFRRRHEDAVLVALWHNLWPASAASMRLSPHVAGPPALDAEGRQRMTDWAVENGVPAGAFVDLGLLPNGELPSVLRHVDAAVFPARCEGGTNLVAMECMASGVPTVLSDNTGHRDLIDDEACFVLSRQDPVPGNDGGTEGWGESSVEELVETLEMIHADRALAALRGARGAGRMAGFTWERQVARLLDAVDWP